MSGPPVRQRLAVLIVARRLDGARSGSNTYLKDYLRLCRRAGLDTRIVCAPRRSFGNLAWARLDPDIVALARQIDWPQSLRIGSLRLSLSLRVWGRMIRRLCAEAPRWIRRRIKAQSAPPYPSLLGAELSSREAAEVLLCVARNTHGAGHQAGPQDGPPIEAVTAEYSSLAPLLKEVTAKTRIVFLHDLFSLRAESFAAKGLKPDHVALSLEAEALRCRDADLVIHASCLERDRFRPLLPKARHEWMPPAVRRQPVSVGAAPSGSDRVDHSRKPHGLFVGSCHQGNAEALRFLREQIWPAVRIELPKAELWIAGTIANGISEAEAEAEGLVRLGQVADLTPFGGGQAIGLAPIKFGSGIPIKVVDYLSLGMSVAVTSGAVGAFGGALEGLVAEAESDADYAPMICALLRDDSARLALAARADQAETHLSNCALFDLLKG